MEFAAAAFFSGGPEEADRVGLALLFVIDRMHGGASGEECGDGACCDEVVSACVADAGEGVVFGVESDVACGGCRDITDGMTYFECCREAVCLSLYGILRTVGRVRLEEGADGVVGAVFFEGEFGIGPDLYPKISN